MRAKKTFLKLRALLIEYDMSFEELGHRIGRSYAHISNSFRGARSWDLWEMYAILDLFNISHEELHEYFPKDGIAA